MVRGWILVVLVLGCPLMSTATTYYLSPDGSDQGTGHEHDSWRRWAHAVPQLKPGDTLILRPGTYTDSTSGDASIDCTAGPRNGTPGQPITLKAEPERQALIAGTGTGITFSMRACRYWIIEGLQVSGADAAGSDFAPAVMDIRESSHLIFRRLLVHHSNRALNNSLMLLLETSQSLVEDSEFYWFHRYALINKFGVQNTFRRNYAHSRGYADRAGGYPSGMPDRGDAGIGIYPGSGLVLENNVSEGNGVAVELEAHGPMSDNRMLGHISLNDLYGVLVRARGDSAATMPQQTTLQDLVVVTPERMGVYARGAKQTRCVNCSVFGGTQGLVADQMDTYPGDGAPSFFAENPLVVQTSLGINMVAQASWHIDSPNMYGNGTNFSPNKGEPHITNIRTMDPGLGSCYVVIPDGSPMKGKGQGGKDIGANVVYRYQDGVLTGIPLWSAGGFPCGAVVPGVNDVAGSSCRDVHERLHVNAHGCVVPTGQGPPPPSAGPLPAPTAFRVVMP